MDRIRLCLSTQTPPVRFLHDDLPEGRDLAEFREGVDVRHAPGGVTRMLPVLLDEWRAKGRLDEARWLALSRHGPERVRLAPDAWLEQVRIPGEGLPLYAQAKAALWDALHALARVAPAACAVAPGMRHLSDAMAERALALHARAPFDLFYVHDFQLLPLGRRLPRGVPRLFRWHIPVSDLAPALRAYVATRLNAYDGVVVSTRATRDAMRAMGVRVPIHCSYPYLDERRHVVTAEDVARFEARWGLDPDDVVFLVVARMDPMKSQDVAIRALARIVRREPRAKLVLVGGGGFSGGVGGLGLPQGERWQAKLLALARDLGVLERVVLTGGLPDREVDVAYTRAQAVLLPSRLEGFGLAVVEGWLHGRPALVSRGAGVAELVEEGANGHAFDPEDDEALARAMLSLARDPEAAAAMGAHGRETAKACGRRAGPEEVWRVAADLLPNRFSGSPPFPPR